MTYEPLVCPHTDRWTGYVPDHPPVGWRDGFEMRMLASLQRMKGAKLKGALSVLYALRNETCPPAYYRAVSTAQFQDAICRILGAVDAR